MRRKSPAVPQCAIPGRTERPQGPSPLAGPDRPCGPHPLRPLTAGNGTRTPNTRSTGAVSRRYAVRTFRRGRMPGPLPRLTDHPSCPPARHLPGGTRLVRDRVPGGVELMGFEPTTPCMPSQSHQQTGPHDTSPDSTSPQVRMSRALLRFVTVFVHCSIARRTTRDVAVAVQVKPLPRR
jgi:hypothetical protein